jgi:LDH2 family malate/lactate/ureidoglycolate dehydrogenase
MADGAIPGADGHFYLALNIAAFEDPKRFKRRVDGIIGQIHASPVATGFRAVYAPGELEELTRREYLRDGIPLNAHTLEDLSRVCRQLGLEFAF